MPGANVERWDTYEISLQGRGTYDNPFTEVYLTAKFTHKPSGREIGVDGFYDGNSIWRIRFMPLKLGVWTYKTESQDSGLNGQQGEINCIPPEKPYLHGPLHARGFHFQHADGTWRYLTSTRLSCQFAPPSVWNGIVDFLKTNRINRVLFIMGGIAGTVRELYGEDMDFSRYNVERFQAIDAFIDKMRRSDIMTSPYFYYFNDGDQRGMTYEQDEAYIKYGMSRFGAYCNVMPCLSNQLEGKYTLQGSRSTEYDPRNHEWGNKIGNYLAEKAVFGVPVTVHNPLENQKATNPSFYTYLRDWQFPWADFMLRQMQVGSLGAVAEFRDDVPEQWEAGSVKGAGNTVFPRQYNPRAYANHNRLLIELRRFGIPVINEEPGYEMKGSRGTISRLDPKNYNTQTSETLLPTFWTAATAGAYSMWGSVDTYNMVDPLPGLQNSVTPQYIRVLHDFMIKLAYWEMEPDNDVVSPWEIEIEGKAWRTNFCYSKSGEVYLIFSLYGGRGQISLPEGRDYRMTRLNPRTGDEADLGTTTGGVQEYELPLGEWVLLYRTMDDE